MIVWFNKTLMLGLLDAARPPGTRLARSDGARQGIRRDPTAAAEAAEAAEADATGEGLEALGASMHSVLDLRVSAVVPLAVDRLDLERDRDLSPGREASAAAMERLTGAAHDDGSLAPEVTFADIGTLLVLAGLRSGGLPGPGLSREGLHDARDAAAEPD